MAITGDQRLLKRINRMALVRLVRSQPGLSRAELSASTGLTKSTVSLLVQELIDDGWLREDSVLVTGAIGRRPTPLRLDGRRLTLIGAEVSFGCLRVVSMSLDGEILQREDADISVSDKPEFILEHLAEMLSIQANALIGGGREILGIGVGVPGAVQEHAGVLLVAPNLGWRNVPVREILEAGLMRRCHRQFPFFVQNDGDVAALAEVEFSNVAVGDPLLFVGLGVGVGAGVVVGGRLLLGTRGFAGEVGHIQLQHGGPRCSCGRQGCAEAFFGLQSLADAQHCSIEEFERRALSGDPVVLDALGSAGTYLGVLLHNLWTTLDPALIVVGGRSCRFGSAFLKPARDTFEGLAKEAGLEIPQVIESRFGDLSVAAGGAALALHELLLPI